MTLPIIDLSPWVHARANAAARADCAQALLAAFGDTGFAILRGTGVPAATLDAMRAAVRAVFDTPRLQYRQHQVEKTNYRGYVPLAFFTPNAGGTRADRYEAWKLHWEVDAHDPVCAQSPLYRPNRWPPIAHDVRTAVLAYWAEMDRLNATVLTALAGPLGLDAAVLLAMLDRPLSNMTLLNYPPAAPHDTSWGIHPHKDFNFLTFLAHDPVGGLEVRTRDGQWLDAHCDADAFVVNIGDMLELLSGGRLVSTPHRVVNHSGLQRQSFPYFSVPRHDVLLQPLLPPLPGFVRAPLQSGAASHAIWYSNWPDEAVQDPSFDLGHYG